MATTNDPVSPNYVPAYSDPVMEAERLERCLQQQVEDCFTTIGRIQNIARVHALQDVSETRWRTLREGLRCWRIALSGR